MVRSEPTPQRPPGNEDVLVTIVETAARLAWAAIKFELRLIVWAVLFPMVSVPIALAILAAYTGGLTAVPAVAVPSLMILLGWRLGHPASFQRLVSGRIWKRWRRWSTYRQPWRHLCAMHGLTVVLNEHVAIPRMHRVKVPSAPGETYSTCGA